MLAERIDRVRLSCDNLQNENQALQDFFNGKTNTESSTTFSHVRYKEDANVAEGYVVLPAGVSTE